MATLAIFTPSYNRAHTIGRTYVSLCRQTSKDFKWIIVDDGSTDNTKELAEKWLAADNGFVIEYYWKENGGMASAHNVAYEHIDTELAVCIDSDDWMPDDGVELIIKRWRKDGSDRYSGMIGLDIFENGEVIGTSFPKGLKSCKVYDMKRKYGVVCDKKYVIKTEAIRPYLPYPIFPGEKNLEVNYVYDQMSLDGDFLCYNDVFSIVEYQPDGLTLGIMKQYVSSPRSYMFSRNSRMNSSPYFAERFRQAIHYVSSAIFAHDATFLKKTNKKVLVVVATPLGLMLNVYIHFKNRHLFEKKV